MNKGFLNKIVYSTGTWVTGLVLILLSFLVNLLSPGNSSAFSEIRPGMNFLLDWTDYNTWLVVLFQNHYFRIGIQALSLGGITLLVQYIATNHKIIRVRSFFPFFFICLFAAAFIPHIDSNGPFLACLFFCWSIYRLFYSFEKENATSAIFDASFLLSLSSLFLHGMVYLLPVLWLVMVILQSFNIKTFLASLIGFLSIFWIVAGVSFVIGDFQYLYVFWDDITSFQLLDFREISIAGDIFCVFQIMLTLIVSVYFLNSQHRDKLHTRNNIFSLLLLLVALSVLCLFSGDSFTAFMFIFLSVESIILGYFFSLEDNLFTRTLFVLCFILSMLFYFMY